MSDDPVTTVNDASEPAAGSIVAGRYRLMSRIGAGGMGAVYRGEHVTLRKPVAVKFLHRFASADPELVTRFEREAQTAAAIDHPHIAKAIDFGKLPDGTLFLVMEFVEGPTLSRAIEAAPRMPASRAIDIIGKIGSALTRAHALGIVHRDIKPDNVILCERDGDADFVKVIDFGIARMTTASNTGSTPLTQIGTVFGTPGYLAPEQAMGQRVDAAADQYALGVVAFQVLTGRMPFVADDAIALLQQHVMAPIPRATEFAPDLPPAVDDVFVRMLAKRPADRFPSVDAAVEALGAALATQASSSAPRPGSAMATVAARPSAPQASAWSAPVQTSAGAASPPLSTSVPAAAPTRKSLMLPLSIGGVAVAALIGFFSLRSPATTPNTSSPIASPRPTVIDAGAPHAAATHESPPAPNPSPGTPTAPTNATPTPPTPHTIGPSSRNCHDGSCACRNAMACSYTCGEEPCATTCERMHDCRGQCGDHCTQTCRDGTICDLHCGDDCHVACRNLHDCRVQCDEGCAVDCSMMMNCQVRMRSGDVVCGERTGRCDVQCAMPDGRWQFATRCAHGRYHCPPGPC
jgi:serine/threonine-protein kinase